MLRRLHVVQWLKPLCCCLLAMNHGLRVGLQYFIVKLFRVELFNGTVEDSRGDPLHFLNGGWNGAYGENTAARYQCRAFIRGGRWGCNYH